MEVIMPLAPFNIRILDPDTYIPNRNILPVTSHAIYESSSNRLHPDGFFSEVIFGQIGSKERLVKHGYLDLHTKVITPHLYKVITTLKAYYKDIMAGKVYAIYDNKEKELIRVSQDTEGAETGYSFFIKYLPKIEFKKNNSTIRNDKIDLLTKYKDLLLMNKMIILPAGLRDLRETHGKVTTEDINKLYYNLLSLTQVLPDQETDDKLYDGIRFQIQTKVLQIYNYIMDLMDGKGGFAQSKYAARAIALSSRNVITAPAITRTDRSDAANMFSIGEVQVPVFQAMKCSVPLMAFQFNSIFFQYSFNSQSTSVTVVDKNTLEIQYCDVDLNELKKFTTTDGIESIINKCRNNEFMMRPVTIKVKPNQLSNKETEGYLCLVYDNGKDILMFKSKNDFMQYYRREDTYSTDKVIDLDKRLEGFDPNKVLLFGSLAASIYGNIHYPGDTDLIVDDDLFEEIKKDKNYVKKDNGVYTNEERRIDVYNELILVKDKLTFSEFKKKHEYTVGNYHLVSPDFLLMSYRESNRKKDKKKIEFLESIVPDPSLIRPLTYIEMTYIAAYTGLSNRYGVVTRYPVLNVEGISPAMIHVVSTVQSRSVRFRDYGDQELILPDYPILSDSVKSSMSVHPSTLAAYNGDHDGDVLSLSILMSNDATAELKNYFESSTSMVNSSGNLIYGLGSGRIVKFCMFATSYHQLSEHE